MADQPGFGRKLVQTIGAVRTGIFILIITGIVSAAGTVVLQRPLTDPEEMQRAYAPGTLRVLDAIGMTDVYHAWWYAALLALLAISIIFASIERWPVVWKFYSQPYRRATVTAPPRAPYRPRAEVRYYLDPSGRYYFQGARRIYTNAGTHTY